MAVIIGRSKGWLWWLAGCFCALVFGRGVRGDEPVESLFGVKPAPPRDAAPVAPKPPPPPVQEDARQKIDKLINDYLAAQGPAPATAELKDKIARLIKELGDNEWSVREAASKALVDIGQPALAALKEALKSKDAEVAMRAREAVEKIEGAGSTVEGLRALGHAAQAAVQKRLLEERRLSAEKAGAAAEAELAGKKDEAEKARAGAKQAQANTAALAKLLTLLAQAGPATGGAQPEYGVRPRASGPGPGLPRPD